MNLAMNKKGLAGIIFVIILIIGISFAAFITYQQFKPPTVATSNLNEAPAQEAAQEEAVQETEQEPAPSAPQPALNENAEPEPALPESEIETSYETPEIIEKLRHKCGILYEGANDESEAINFMFVPADTSYMDESDAQYSNNLGAFIAEAQKNIDDFLSIYPINKHKDAFNFYYTTNVIDCDWSDEIGFVTCDEWEETADKCDFPYDEVIILQRKIGGGHWAGPFILAASQTTTTMVHEIGHYLGFKDLGYYNDEPGDYIASTLSLPVGPNQCTDLDCCGREVCPFEHWTENVPIEWGGPDCCLYQGSVEGTAIYIPNEFSAMTIGVPGTFPLEKFRYCALKFNRLEIPYLDELLEAISSSGKESVRCGQYFRPPEYCNQE